MKLSVNYPFQTRDSSIQFFNFWRWLAANWYFYEDVFLMSIQYGEIFLLRLSFLIRRYLIYLHVIYWNLPEHLRCSSSHVFTEKFIFFAQKICIYIQNTVSPKNSFFFRNPLAKVTFLALLHFRTPTPSIIGALVPSIIGAFVLSIIGTLIPSILYITLFPVSKGHFSHKGLGLRMGLWLGEVRKVQQHQNYFWSVLEQNNANFGASKSCFVLLPIQHTFLN